MSNADALRKGTAKARAIIENHILNDIMIPMAQGLISYAVEERGYSSNMTGNTINAYVAGVYFKGKLIHTVTSAGSIHTPLQSKLKEGDVFESGWGRWDGQEQRKSFKAKVSTDGSMEPSAGIAFIQSYKVDSQGWTVVVCNGVEYATFQENEMEIDVLTSNFNYAKMFVPTMFKPIPD